MANILVVDDEVGIRELLTEILTDEGHDVRAAEDVFYREAGGSDRREAADHLSFRAAEEYKWEEYESCKKSPPA